MEVPSTPTERASYFADIARGKSSRTYLINTDLYSGSSSCGVTIGRRNGKPFQIRQATGIIEALDNEASKLGGQRIGEFDTKEVGGDLPASWYGDYEFNAERFASLFK